MAESVINASGLGRSSHRITWDMKDQSPIVRNTANDGDSEQMVEIFVDDLLQGAFEVHIDEYGCLSISGERTSSTGDRSLFDWRFFNALLNPGAEPDRLLSVIKSREAMGKVLETANVISAELHEVLHFIVHQVWRAMDIVEAEGVREPFDLIPGRNIARVASILLFNTREREDALYTVVKQITDGRGLDVPAFKALINDSVLVSDRFRGGMMFDFSLDRISRWVGHLLGPTDALPAAPVADLACLSEQPRYVAMFQRWPKALDIYQTVDGGGGGSCTPAQISACAPYMTLQQVAYVLRHAEGDSGDGALRNGVVWPAHDLACLRYVLELKRRVSDISERYGGLAYVPQAAMISMFLGEALRASQQWKVRYSHEAAMPCDNYELGYSLLGPAEVAALLQSGLASPVQSRDVQQNRRLLLDLCFATWQPRSFIAEVLAEMGGPSCNARVLAHSLMALLCMREDRFRVPLDLPSLLGSSLGVSVPRREDFLAGGRYARHSYFEAVTQVAQKVIDDAEPYVALKSRLQVVRHPPRPPVPEPAAAAVPARRRRAPDSDISTSVAAAKAAIAAADSAAFAIDDFNGDCGDCDATTDFSQLTVVELFAELRRRGLDATRAKKSELVRRLSSADEKGDADDSIWETDGDLDEATSLYREAFSACAEVLRNESHAIHWPWLKAFWARNHEALVVLSVLRNCQDDVDEVRRWVCAQARRPFDTTWQGGSCQISEQELLDLVVDALYFHEDERERVRSDPLVRLLIDPPAEGRYDFTVISAMGVVTDGKKGPELEKAFERLEEQRGVVTIRADTGTARSFEYNAQKIEEAVRESQTPWGYVGYSQGCANGLVAETILHGGTPEQQRLLAGLRTRNLLFGAHNGSAHSTCGDGKFLRAMTEAEEFLKFHQAHFSKECSDLFLHNLSMFLNSKEAAQVMGGVQSLSHTGCVAMWREAQQKSDVPTCSVRGVCEPENTPEILEMLSSILTKQLESPLHDTQVSEADCVAHPIWVRNSNAALMKRCDMGGYVQRTHHWSPLIKAVSFLTTERDEERCVFFSPKDRHVFPWVEVNARFGVIAAMEC